MLNQPWADKSTTPMVLVHVHRFPNKQTKPTHAQSTQTKPTVHTQSTQTIPTIPRAIHPNETVGAVPVCPPERPRSGVSISKNTRIVRGILTMDAPLQGDTGGHTGAAPTNLRYTFTCNPPNDINHPRAIHPNETRKQSTHTSGAEMHRALPPP